MCVRASINEVKEDRETLQLSVEENSDSWEVNYAVFRPLNYERGQSLAFWDWNLHACCIGAEQNGATANNIKSRGIY